MTINFNKYAKKVQVEILDTYGRLAAFPDFRNHLRYDWHIWSDGYTDNLTIRLRKKDVRFWQKKWNIIAHDVERIDCITRALQDEEKDAMLIEAIAEAKAYLELKEKEMHQKMIDFDVKFKGLQETVKNALLEMR